MPLCRQGVRRRSCPAAGLSDVGALSTVAGEGSHSGSHLASANSRCKSGISPGHRSPAFVCSQARLCRHLRSLPCPAWTSAVWCVYHGGIQMEFEFDPLKSAANREKHGVDFVQAQELWQDPMRIEVPARTTGEPRWLVIGRMGNKHWSAVVTYREDRVRIISVRRARDEEIEIY